MTRSPASCFSLWFLVSTCAISAASQEIQRSPEAIAGPYRVVVEKVLQNVSFTRTFQGEEARREGAAVTRRSVQAQLAVFAPDRKAAAGLTSFQISSVSAKRAAQLVDLPHYGGLLEGASGLMVLRVYLHLPAFPTSARDIRSIEGQIIAWEQSAPVEITIPIGEGKAGVTVERDGVRATVRELRSEGNTARLVLWLEAPPGSALQNAADDDAYGISLLTAPGQKAKPGKGEFTQPRPHQAEYRLSFSGLQGPPREVRVHALHRAGSRRAYPFRINRIPIPARPVPLPKPP